MVTAKPCWSRDGDEVELDQFSVDRIFGRTWHYLARLELQASLIKTWIVKRPVCTHSSGSLACWHLQRLIIQVTYRGNTLSHLSCLFPLEMYSKSATPKAQLKLEGMRFHTLDHSGGRKLPAQKIIACDFRDLAACGNPVETRIAIAIANEWRLYDATLNPLFPHLGHICAKCTKSPKMRLLGSEEFEMTSVLLWLLSQSSL